MKSVLATALLLVTTTAAHADICGIVTQEQGRTAANLIRAQIAASSKKQALLTDDFSNKNLVVTDALVSNKLFANMDNKKYYEVRVKKANGKEEVVDIGHLYLQLNGTKTFVSLNALTGCGIGVAESKAILSQEKAAEGTSTITGSKNKAQTLEISGDTAVNLMNLMTSIPLQTIDAAESSTGKRMFWKDGRDVSCQITQNQEDGTCYIQLNNISAGEIN